MIRDIISFSLADEKFAVDLISTPLILTASEYLPKYTKNHFPQYIQFDNNQIEIIDLHHILNIKDIKILNTSKILVGEFYDKMYGLIVDKVIEIISIREDFNKIFTKNKNSNNFVLGNIVLFNEIFKLVSVELLIKNYYLNKNIISLD